MYNAHFLLLSYVATIDKFDCNKTKWVATVDKFDCNVIK